MLVPIISLLVAMSMLLSGCWVLDVYFRTPSDESLFGIPTGYYSLIDEDTTESVFDIIYIDNKIEFIENYIDTYSCEIYQDEDGKIYMGQKNEHMGFKEPIVYLYEDQILLIPWRGKILHYKIDKHNNLENYGIPKGTYQLLKEDLSGNNEMSTQLVIDGGIKYGEKEYKFSQDEDGKIHISTSGTDNRKQIIYFYENKLLEVHWSEEITLHFKQN